MALKTVGDLVQRLQKIEQSVAPKSVKPRLLAVAEELKPLGTRAAAGDLGGDARFSGWPKAGALEAQANIHKDGMGLTMHRARQSAGPWRVAEVGRGHSNAAGFAGPGANRKTGATNRTKKGNLRKVSAFTGGSKWSGYTTGKNTWSDATGLMEAKAPGLFTKAQTKAVIDAFLGK